MKCFWAYPENYEHVAGHQYKLVSVVFTGDEVEDYNRLISISGIEGAPCVIKKLIKEYI